MLIIDPFAFIHNIIQIVYKLFKTLNIQVDHKFNAKLSDYYGFTTKSQEEIPSSLNSASSLVDPVRSNLYLLGTTENLKMLITS